MTNRCTVQRTVTKAKNNINENITKPERNCQVLQAGRIYIEKQSKQAFSYRGNIFPQGKRKEAKTMTEKAPVNKGRYIFLLRTLLFSYIITGGLLLLLAFMLYKLKLKENIVSVCIIAIYIISTFFLGFVTGRKIGEKKFLWGLIMGSAYFIVLLTVSLCINKNVGDIANDLLTTFLMCAGSGMLGGMLS